MVAEHITNLPVTGKDNGRRARTQMLVVHSAETPLAAGYASSVTRNWLNRSDVEASINAFAGPDTLVRSVNTDNAAWHATWANSMSIGYETTGYAAFTRAQWLTTDGKNMLDRLGREMAMDASIYGIPLRWLSTAEVNQIANGNTTIKGLATHRQIDPVNRTDPGDGFPYDVLLANIRAYAGGSTKPQGSTPIPIKEDSLSAAEVKTIIQAISDARLDVKKSVNAVPANVWAETVGRPSGKVSVKQELADAKSEAIKANSTLVALQNVIGQLAGGSAIDYGKVGDAVTAALKDGLVTVDVNVAGGK